MKKITFSLISKALISVCWFTCQLSFAETFQDIAKEIVPEDNKKVIVRIQDPKFEINSKLTTVRVPDNLGLTVLMYVVRYHAEIADAAEMLKAILSHPQLNINEVQTTSLKTALIFAAQVNNAQVFRMLLDAGADFNHRDSANKLAIDYVPQASQDQFRSQISSGDEKLRLEKVRKKVQRLFKEANGAKSLPDKIMLSDLLRLINYSSLSIQLPKQLPEQLNKHGVHWKRHTELVTTGTQKVEIEVSVLYEQIADLLIAETCASFLK